MWIFCYTHPSRWEDVTQCKFLILQTTHQFSRKAWFHSFAKTQLHQVWLTGPIWTVICITFIQVYLDNTNTSHLPRHPCPLGQFPLHLFSADPGIMAPVPGPMVKVGTITTMRRVKESIPALTAPFGLNVTCSALTVPCPANTSGVETVTRMPTSSVNNVNSVQLRPSFSPSHSLFPFPVNVGESSAKVTPMSSRPQGVPLSSIRLVARTFQQDLVHPSRVTPLMFKNFGVNSVFAPIKSKWIMWLQRLWAILWVLVLTLP